MIPLHRSTRERCVISATTRSTRFRSIARRVFEPVCLSELEQLSTRVAGLEGVRSLSSLMDVTHFRWVAESDWVEIRPFIEGGSRGPGQNWRDCAAQALSDPVYRQTLVGDRTRGPRR